MLIRKRGNYLLNYETPMREALTQRPDLQLQSKPLQRAPLKMVVSKRASIGGQQLLDQLEGAYRSLKAENAIQELPES
jgi:polar amino acid transport system substrate-binding protein